MGLSDVCFNDRNTIYFPLGLIPEAKSDLELHDTNKKNLESLMFLKISLD